MAANTCGKLGMNPKKHPEITDFGVCKKAKIYRKQASGLSQ
jgi:hypothetical protein